MDMRDAFFKTVYQYALMDKRYLVLTADHGAFYLNKIIAELPKQYYNVGIAEQSMMSIAAGLALQGKYPIVYGINPFVSLRCLEQVQVDLCSMQLPICIVGIGAGFTYSTDGPTHHGLNDQAIMSMLPNLQVYNVSDAWLTQQLTQAIIQQDKPSYIRIEKGTATDRYPQETLDCERGCYEFAAGNEALIISTGYMTQVSLNLQDKLRQAGIAISCLDIFRVNPLPEQAILAISDRFEHIICIEENYYQGGLGMQIQALMQRHRIHKQISSHAVGEGFYFNYGSREDLHVAVGLDAECLYQKLKIQLTDKALVC